MFHKRQFNIFVMLLALASGLILFTPSVHAGGRLIASSAQGMSAPVAVSSDDRYNTTTTAWWVWSGQSVTDASNFVATNNARIIDLYVESISPTFKFTVTYVSNSGAYAKAWAWLVDVDASTLLNYVTVNNMRIISLKAFDVGSGVIHFAAVMISNTGADAKTWYFYYNQTTAQLTTLWQNNNARITQVNSYVTGGQTKYAAVMISNTGADNITWWWWVNQTVGSIVSLINSENSRLIDLDRDPTTGNYNVVMVSCASGCPLWWWYVGTTGQQMIDVALQDGARVIDTNVFPGCGGLCYSFVLINNSNDITSRVGQLLRNGTDGLKGLYLKEVNGAVLANLEDGYVFEPASAIKVFLNAYVMRRVQDGTSHLTDHVNTYVPPIGSSCPGNTVSGTETLSTALGEMMRHSDNSRTRVISDTFGANNAIAFAQSYGINNTHINHIIGCGGPIPNQTTLDDLGMLYEKTANGTMLNSATRDTMYSLMAGKAEYLLEGYDWTGLWSTDIPNIINQEAPFGMTTFQKQMYQGRMNLAYKAGNYNLCVDQACSSLIYDIAIAGWAQIPFCGLANPSSRQYVFGIFINTATNLTNASNTFNATKSELLREQIHAGLASCANQTYLFLPLIRH